MIKIYEKELQTAKKAAEKASKILLKYHRNEYKISEKGENDIVTQVDTEAEKAIVNVLQKRFPDYGILAEEGNEIKTKSDKKWLIDPLDGTHNFARGSDIFGTSIALEEKGNIILGLIYMPKINEKMFAVKGKGAFLNNKRVYVSNKNDNMSAVLFGGIRLIKKDKNVENAFLSLTKKYPSNFRVSGCAVYNCAFVASGRAEVLVTFDSKPWDVAAGGFLIEEAGGNVTDVEGNKWDPYKKNFVMSNDVIHKDILSCLKN